MKTILAIDDESSIRASYKIILGDTYRLLLAENVEEGFQYLDERNVDLLLLDIAMPGISGIEMLATLCERGDEVPVIMVTASNSVDMAVKAIKLGAHEFVIKPFDVDDLLVLVERTLAGCRAKRELGELRERDRADFSDLIGDSAALEEALCKARVALKVDSTVLITGGTGTGKDVLARAIHNSGPRKDGPFVALSCCAIPPNLVESELFGIVKGAFTGANESRPGKMQIADGGTLFLDEIGEMPMEAQAKLLQVLQNGSFYSVGGSKLVEVDVRFICATNRDFKQSIAEGLFREDLYYRINVLPIEMPPLSSRRGDIPMLVQHFIAKHAPRINAKVRGFSPRAMAMMGGQDWPGNVRELENIVERILVNNLDAKMIQPEALEAMLPSATGKPIDRLEEFEGLVLQEATNRLEKYLIERALERSNHVQSQAAEYLGTTRRILKYKMDQLDIDFAQEEHPLAS